MCFSDDILSFHISRAFIDFLFTFQMTILTRYILSDIKNNEEKKNSYSKPDSIVLHTYLLRGGVCILHLWKE